MSGLRADWLRRLESSIERLTDELDASDVRQSAPLLRAFADGVESPPDTLHGAVLSTMLLDMCGRLVRALHDQNPPAPCRCEASLWAHVGRFTEWRQYDPRWAFRDWVRMFYGDIEREHPSDTALHVAALIRQAPARAWTMPVLAGAADTTAMTLRRDFEARYGMRPLVYLHLVRVVQAFPLLRTTAKVESVAADVGYKSKKDLYAALGQWSGLTPTALRSMPDAEFAWLERELKVRCFCSAVRRQRIDAQPRRFSLARTTRTTSGARTSPR